ncbi:MAG: type II toxin-antitoxin system VapC family toxin [Nitrospinae bacterium]|nr:type II toxin-antitoxin system VapC family toxin [Nitrospinota bacterium]
MGQVNALVPGPRVYLDTNISIYALEGYPAFTPALTEIFSRIDVGDLIAITSELTLAETLVKPLMDNNKPLYQAYISALQPRNGFSLATVSRDILIAAASLRASNTQIRLPDAIHAATAIEHECASFLTNDNRLAALSETKGMRVVMLSSLSSS